MTRYPVAGRTVAITGSTGGLGDALATELRRRGANLALMDIDEDALAEQARRLGGPTVARSYLVNVRELASLDAAMTAAADEFGRLDVAVAGAGVERTMSMELADPADFERIIDINLTGVWRTLRAALPHVREQRGYLLAVSSMAAFIHSPLQAPYTASKAGIWAMCDSIRLELRHEGIDVGTVHPTFFATPMMERVLAEPVGQKLWGQHERWPWKMVPLETVVAGTADAIERRAALTVIPKANTMAARSAGLMRPFIDRVGWRKNAIPDTLAALASDDRPNP